MRKSQNSLSFKKSLSKRIVIITTIAIFTIIVAICGALFAINRMSVDREPENNTPYETSTDRNSEKGLPGSDYATGNTEDTDTRDPNENSDSPPSPRSGTPAIEVSSFTQNNDTVNIKTILSSVKGSGKCVFTFSKDDTKPLVKEVKSDGKTCSASAKTAEFSKLDIWTLTIAFYSGSKKVVDTSLNVTIN